MKTNIVVQKFFFVHLNLSYKFNEFEQKATALHFAFARQRWSGV